MRHTTISVLENQCPPEPRTLADVFNHANEGNFFEVKSPIGGKVFVVMVVQVDYNGFQAIEMPVGNRMRQKGSIVHDVKILRSLAAHIELTEI